MIKIIRRIIRLLAISVQTFVFRKIYRMNISHSARISFGTKLDKVNGKGIFIDDETYIASGAIIFTHDYINDIFSNTIIGKRCFIGANAIIMSGITLGDEVIVGSGSIVTKDVPSNCIVAGNPAKIIREGISTKKYGRLSTCVSEHNDFKFNK